MNEKQLQHEQATPAGDEAMRRRLARLGSMPVDTQGLDGFIGREIGPSPARAREVQRMRLGWWDRVQSYRAYAASFVALAVLCGVLFMTWSSPAVANASAVMARVHEDLVSGRVHAVQVDSIEAANRAIKEQWPAGPGMPDLPADHVMKCCMRDIGDKRVACVLMQVEGRPVSMAVARAGEMKHHGGRVVERDGRRFTVEEVSGLTMVMTERDGKWVCLMGKVGERKMLELAGKLEF